LMRKWPLFLSVSQIMLVLFSALAVAVQWEERVKEQPKYILIAVVAAYCLYARDSITGTPAPPPSYS
jgi:hypothetical protein